MKIQYYYSKGIDTKNWGSKEETREYKWHDTAPLKTEEVWNFVAEEGNGSYLPQKHKIRILDDTEVTLFQCQFITTYMRCCGMREIGEIRLDVGKEAVLFFYNKMQTHNARAYGSFGCLLYTEVKDPSGELMYPDGSNFCELWPGAKTASDWWYNPNSGNWCRNWTLTINQELAKTAEDDEESDDWDCEED